MRLRSLTVGLLTAGVLLTSPFACFAEEETLPDNVQVIKNTGIYTKDGYQLTYTYTDTETIITECSTNAVSVEIPSDFNGLPVVKLEEGAFYGCNELQSVTIPDSVTAIGAGVFYECKALTSVTLSQNLTTIADSAFAYCEALSAIDLPDSLTSLAYSAFAYCGELTALDLPDNLTTIGEEAFYACSGLTEITLPAGLTDLGDYAFEGCQALTRIDVADGNTAYESRDGVLFTKGADTLVKFPDSSQLTSYRLPDETTTIAPWAFVNASGLKSLELNRVQTIGDDAFYYCTGLTELVIPEGVTKLGGSMFGYCTGLTSFTIPDSVTELGEYCFVNCTGIKDMTIPASVKTIGNYALGYLYDSEAGEAAVREDFKLSVKAGTQGARYAKKNEIAHDTSRTNWKIVIPVSVSALVLVLLVILIRRRHERTAAQP